MSTKFRLLVSSVAALAVFHTYAFAQVQAVPVAAGAAGGGGAAAGISAGTLAAVSAGAVAAAAVGIAVGTSNSSKTIASLAGTLNVTLADGTKLSIDAGTGVQLDAKGNPIKDSAGNTIQPLAALLQGADGKAVLAAITAKVQEISSTAATSTDTATSQIAAGQLAAIMKLMVIADPDALSNLVTTSVATLTKNGASSALVQNAVAAVIVGASTNNSSSDADSVITAAKAGAEQNSVTLPSTLTTFAGADNLLLTNYGSSNGNGGAIGALNTIDVSLASPSS